VDVLPVCPRPTPCLSAPAWGQGPLPRALSATPRGPIHLDDSPLRGGPHDSPPGGGAGHAILGIPSPLLAHRARIAGPPRTRGRTPGPRCRVHRTMTARIPLPRRGRPHDQGRPSLVRTGAAPGPHTGKPGGQPSWPARHTRKGPPPWLLAAGTATPLKRGIVTVRHMAPTLGEPDSPEICPTNAYFKMFRWRPTCDHLVAHHAQLQFQYFPGIRNPPGRAPT